MTLLDQVIFNMIEYHKVVSSKQDALFLIDLLRYDQELLKESLIFFDDYKIYKFFGKNNDISESTYLDILNYPRLNVGAFDKLLITELFNILPNPSDKVIKKAIELSSADCYYFWKGKYKKALKKEYIKYASQSKFDAIVIDNIPHDKINKQLYIEMIKGYGMSIGYFKTIERCQKSKFRVFDKDVQCAILTSPEFLKTCTYSGNSPDEMVDELFNDMPKQFFYNKMTSVFLSKIYDLCENEDNKKQIMKHPNYKNPAQLILESLKKATNEY